MTGSAELPQPLVPAEVRPSLFDPCTCLRDGSPCRTCRLWNRHLAWFEGRPDPEDDPVPASCSAPTE